MTLSQVFRRNLRNPWVNVPVVIVAILLLYIGPRLWIDSTAWQFVWVAVVTVVAIVVMFVLDWAWEQHTAKRPGTPPR